MSALVYRGCELPEDLAYDVERDVWVRFEEDGLATSGMTDLAQTRCGKVVSIRFKAVGRRVARGRSLATIESAKWVGPFPAALSGEIVATNEGAFLRDVLLANRDPYGAGWLVRIRPSDPGAERAQLCTGAAAAERYRARIDAANASCFRCAEPGPAP